MNGKTLNGKTFWMIELGSVSLATLAFVPLLLLLLFGNWLAELGYGTLAQALTTAALVLMAAGAIWLNWRRRRRQKMSVTLTPGELEWLQVGRCIRREGVYAESTGPDDPEAMQIFHRELDGSEGVEVWVAPASDFSGDYPREYAEYEHIRVNSHTGEIGAGKPQTKTYLHARFVKSELPVPELVPGEFVMEVLPDGKKHLRRTTEDHPRALRIFRRQEVCGGSSRWVEVYYANARDIRDSYPDAEPRDLASCSREWVDFETGELAPDGHPYHYRSKPEPPYKPRFVEPLDDI